MDRRQVLRFGSVALGIGVAGCSGVTDQLTTGQQLAEDDDTTSTSVPGFDVDAFSSDIETIDSSDVDREIGEVETDLLSIEYDGDMVSFRYEIPGTPGWVEMKATINIFSSHIKDAETFRSAVDGMRATMVVENGEATFEAETSWLLEYRSGDLSEEELRTKVGETIETSTE